MQAHIVLAHPEPLSLHAHLAGLARRTLEAKGWQVTSADLHAMGFDPLEGLRHHASRSAPGRFDAQAEQRHAPREGTIPTVVAAEIERLDSADLLILRYPMWWRLPPAVLKGWIDRVFVYGAVHASHASGKRFEAGHLVDKRAMLSVTVGTSAGTCAHDGRSGDLDLLLWPVSFSLAYVDHEVLAPFVACGVEAGLRCSEPGAIEVRLRRIEEDWTRALDAISHRCRMALTHHEPLY